MKGWSLRHTSGLGLLVLAIAGISWYFYQPVPPRPDAEAGELSSVANSDADELSQAALVRQRSGETSLVARKKQERIDIAAATARLESINLQANLAALTEEAKTNPALAYALARALEQCANADAVYSRLAKDVGGSISPEKAMKSTARLDETFAKCSGLQSDNLELRFDLAGLAGRAGILEAQLQYRQLATPFLRSDAAFRRPGAVGEFVRNSTDLLNRAAQTGDGAAQFFAYEFFSDGVVIPPDPIRAYGYLVSWNRIRPSAASQRALTNYAATMTPEQLRVATSRASR